MLQTFGAARLRAVRRGMAPARYARRCAGQSDQRRARRRSAARAASTSTARCSSTWTASCADSFPAKSVCALRAESRMTPPHRHRQHAHQVGALRGRRSAAAICRAACGLDSVQTFVETVLRRGNRARSRAGQQRRRSAHGRRRRATAVAADVADRSEFVTFDARWRAEFATPIRNRRSSASIAGWR